MDGAFAWAGFLGAWLLVAGPVFQASLELADEEFERENYHDAMVAVGRPDRVSPWWWLLPPVHVFLSRRGKDAWELVEAYDWPAWLIAVIAPVALVLALGCTVGRSRQDARRAAYDAWLGRDAHASGRDMRRTVP